MSPPHAIHTGEQALERLARVPGGPGLLAHARRRPDVALVGGAVRDLLLGHWPRELDVTVAEDAAGLARELAAAVPASERAYGHPVEPVLHERFGTASVAWEHGRIDVAERRAESYTAPGALPEVRRPATLAEDLARRDFAVNAISLALAGPGRGRLEEFPGALDDLSAGVLRVLHDRSFADDPTRILRLARYSARLGFEIEPHTRRLAEEAVAGGALRTISGGRAGSELLIAVREPGALASLRALDRLGALAALGLPSPFDEPLAAAAAQLLPPEGAHDVMLLAVALHAGEDDATDETVLERMGRLEIPADLARRLLGPSGVEGLAGKLAGTVEGADAYALLDGLPLEVVAVAGALAARRSPRAGELARQWLTAERHVSLAIGGRDLVAAGVPEGPEVGARLSAALRRKREAGFGTREQELRFALDADTAGEGV